MNDEHIDTSNNSINLDEQRSKLLGSLLYFTQVFYKIRTGREFIVSQPVGRESHHIIIARELSKVVRLETNRIIINVAPGSGKSELCRHFIAWALAKYPDSNFLYISFSHERAAANTAIIRDIINLPAYKKMFGVSINPDFCARDTFKTTSGGMVIAFGSTGSITGADAGLPGLDRFSGAVVMDDMHKPDEVFSDTSRESVIKNYENTIVHRARGMNVPFIFIGQRLHEDDLPSYLIEKDAHDWKKVILQTRDVNNNLLYPEVYSNAMLDGLSSYAYAAQHQQNPIPAGGGIFKQEWFTLLDEEPKLLATFITIDTAETDKSYNDATVFSFFGVYKVMNDYAETDSYAVHWIDCEEMRVEPADLESCFRDFYSKCLRHPVKPSTVAIEKKSTGVTLTSILKRVQGVDITDVTRTKASGSKTARFVEMQPYIKKGLVSLPRYGKHTAMCINHMIKITDNNAHRFDDVCFIAGTKISTIFGYKSIEDITAKDIVITPFGMAKVKASGLTAKSVKVIRYRGLTGTPNHPVYSSGAFTPMDTLCDEAEVDIITLGGLISWQYKKLLYSMESNINLWGREGIILVSHLAIKKGKVLKDFMSRFGNFIVERKFRKALLFITKMATILITNLTIWSVFRTSNIWRCMQSKGRKLLCLKNRLTTSPKSENKQRNGIEVPKVGHGIVNTLWLECAKFLSINALCAVIPFFQDARDQSIAAKIASESTMQEKEEIEELQDVYNLTVEKEGVYYADNILVSNCDTAYDSVKLALIDKTIDRLYIRTRRLENQQSINNVASFISSVSKARGARW